MPTNAETPANTAQSAQTLSLNLEDIRNYLMFLAGKTGEGEIFTYWLMPKEGKGVIPGLGILHGTIADILVSVRLNPGATLHVCLNRTNLRGRSRPDMKACRVLCADLDTVRTLDEINLIIEQYSPGLIVESSPGKYHIYWRLDSVTNLDVWSQWQLCIAYLLKGDYKLKDITHSIRVPGVPRILEDGTVFTPWIAGISKEPEELTTIPYMGDVNEVLEEAQKELKKEDKAQSQWHKHAGKGTTPKLEPGKDVSRNTRLHGCLGLYASELIDDGKEVTIELLETRAATLNEMFKATPKGPLPDEEVASVVKSAFQYVPVRIESYIEYKKEQALKSEERTAQLLGLNSLPVTPEVSLNGHAPAQAQNTGFQYDYSTGSLAIQPFSDRSIKDRVLQRFKSSIVRTGKLVYAFDKRHSVWRSQKTTHELIQSYVSSCIDDAIQDPRLEAECMEKVGKKGNLEPSDKKKKALQERLYSHKLLTQTITVILDDEHLPRLSISMFDANPFKFFCANGVVNLENGELSDAKPEDLLLRQSPVEYKPEATCPGFDQFLRDIYSRKVDGPSESEDEKAATEEIIATVQEVFGYSISGAMDEQVLCIHSGGGSNGKSRLLGALDALLGDYAARLPATALTKNKNSIEKEIARIGAKIEGKRVMIVDDLDTKSQWDDSLIKVLTDKKLVARNLYEEEKDIPNRAKVHVACNQKPEVEIADIAMRRRLKIIEYCRKFNGTSKSAEDIDKMIVSELSGILNWCMAGLQRIRKRPELSIKWAKEIEDATCTYWADNAGIEDYLSEYLGTPNAPGDKHSVSEILAYLEDSARAINVKCKLSTDRIGRLLSDLGFKRSRKEDQDKKSTFYAVKFIGKSSGLGNL